MRCKWLIFPLFIVALTGCVKSPHDYTVAGNSAYTAKNYGEASNNYSSALQRDPHNAKVAYNSGCSFYKSGEYDLARDNFNKALKYSYSKELSEKSNFNLGNSYYRLSQTASDNDIRRELLGKSLEAYSHVIKKNPNDTFAVKNYYFVKRALDSLSNSKSDKNQAENQRAGDDNKQNSGKKDQKDKTEQSGSNDNKSGQNPKNDKSHNNKSENGSKSGDQSRNREQQRKEAGRQLSQAKSQLKKESQKLQSMQKQLSQKKNKKSAASKQLKSDIKQQKQKVDALKSAVKQAENNLQNTGGNSENNRKAKMRMAGTNSPLNNRRNEAEMILNATMEDEKILQSQLKKQQQPQESVRPRKKQW